MYFKHEIPHQELISLSYSRLKLQIEKQRKEGISHQLQECFRKVNKMRKCKLWMAFTAVEGDINSFTFILGLVAAYKNENIYVWKPWKVLYKEFSGMLSVTFTLCIILSRMKKVQLSKDLFSYWHSYVILCIQHITWPWYVNKYLNNLTWLLVDFKGTLK